MAKYLDCKSNYQKESIKEAAEYIKQGKLELKVLETYPEFLEDYK